MHRLGKGKEKGFALVAVLLVLMLSTVLGMGLLTMTLNSHQAVLANEHNTRAKYLAEYAAHLGLNELQAELKQLAQGRTLSCAETDGIIRRLVENFGGSGSPDENHPAEMYAYALEIDERHLQEAVTLCEKNSPLGTVLGYQYVVEGTLKASGYVHKDGNVPGEATFAVPVQISNIAEVFRFALAAKENVWLNGGAVIAGDVYIGKSLAIHPWVHYPLWYQLKLSGELERLLNLNQLLGESNRFLGQFLDQLLGQLGFLLDLRRLLEQILALSDVLKELLVVEIGQNRHEDVYPKIDGTIVTNPDDGAHPFYHIANDNDFLDAGRELGYALKDVLENLTNVLENLSEFLLNLDGVIEELQDLLFGGTVEAGMHPMKKKYQIDAEMIRENRYLVGEYQFAARSDVDIPNINMKRIKKEVAKKAGFDLNDLEDEYEAHGEQVTETDTDDGITYHYVTGLRKKCLLLLLCEVEETKTTFTVSNRHNPDGRRQHVYYIHGDLVIEGDDLNLGAVFYVSGDVELRSVRKSTNAVAGTIVADGDVKIVNVQRPLVLRAFIWQNSEDGVVALYGVESAVHLHGGVMAGNIVLNGARAVPKGEKKHLVYDPVNDDYFFEKGALQGQAAPPLLTIRHDGQFLISPPAGVPADDRLTLHQIGPWTYVEEKE